MINKHFAFDAILFIPENEISSSIWGFSFISSVFFFNRKINDSTGSAGSGGLVSPKPRLYFCNVTKPHGSFTENIGSPCMKSELCRVIL